MSMSAKPWIVGSFLLLYPQLPGCKKEAPTLPPIERPAGITPGSAPNGPGPSTPSPAESAAAEAVPEPPRAAESISGELILAASRKRDVKPGDKLWIVARPVGGGPPLAIQGHTVEAFPMAFALSGRDSMIKGLPFVGKVNVTARIDKDGNPTTYAAGEIFGTVEGVEVGATGIKVRLDQIQTEEKQLNGGMLPPGQTGAKPPGHP